MYKTILSIVILVTTLILPADIPDPTSDFSANFCNFPLAWSVAKGEGITITIVGDENVLEKYSKSLSTNAPMSKLETISFENIDKAVGDLVFIVSEPESSDREMILQQVKNLVAANRVMVMPAYFGKISMGGVADTWLKFVSEFSAAGGIVTGVHGREYQIGDISYWQQIPVDILAVNIKLNSFKDNGPGIEIDVDLAESATLVVAGISLLLESDPDITVTGIKKALGERSRNISWAEFSLPDSKGGTRHILRAALSEKELKGLLSEDVEGLKMDGLYTGCVFDAALLLDVDTGAIENWRFDCLHIAEAQKHATGKGITVAILDHLFDPEQPSLKDRIVKPASVIESLVPFSPGNNGHGTWMANNLVKIAPDVRIMPIRIMGPGYYKNTEYYAKGIRLAVDQGADIISISHRKVAEEHLADFDAAIKYATDNGVAVAFIHYYGQREDVLQCGAIEFAKYDKGEERLYVVGTNDISAESFPYTWGMSQTAPIVAGVAALVKELNPDIGPVELKEILHKASRVVEPGVSLLDAAKAVSSSID